MNDLTRMMIKRLQRYAAVLSLGATAALLGGQAQAGDVHWSIGVSSPGVAVHASTLPVYVPPAPVYVVPPPPRRVVYHPRPVYHVPPPPPHRWRDRPRHGHHHHGGHWDARPHGRR